MERIEVESSNLAAFTYDEDAQTLEVEFHHGASYKYEGVPAMVVDQFKAAPSKGSFFSQNIRTRYRYSKVE